MWMEMSHRSNKEVWFRGGTTCRYPPLSRYEFSVSIPIFLPALRASDFPWSVCIEHAFDLHPVPCECVCSVFVFSSGLRVNACMFGCICLCECNVSQPFSGLWNRKVSRIPWWRSLTVSILFPEFHLEGAVGRGGQTCVASPADALFCSERDELLQYLYNGLMAPVGLSVFWNATKHGLHAKFQTKILLLFLAFNQTSTDFSV